MGKLIHSLASLFEQLGLDSSAQAIETFITNHKPLIKNMPLEEASFWSTAQANFLKKMKDEDADWAHVVDQLNLLLR